MRIPDYLSPTSLKLFYDNTEDFYCRYLSDNRTPREPQTKPMSIGSAFDAYVKSYLYEAIFGKGSNELYILENLFEAQVEQQNRDWAWVEGKKVFDQYKAAGCLADLMTELGTAIGPPRFEFSVQGEVEGVPLLGKPDVFFLNKEGARVIYDWKVNGYCSAALKSPMKGYLKLREAGKGSKSHSNVMAIVVNGVMINAAMTLEEGDQGWADQLTIYGWLLGEKPGSESLITGIDQICGPATRLRFATHRLRVSPEYQYSLLVNVTNCWDIILSEWIFRELSEEDSKARCRLLDEGQNGQDPNLRVLCS